MTTATVPSAMLVESQVPPMPTSTIATSTGASANAANAMPVSTSKNDIGTWLAPVHHRRVRHDLLVQIDEALRVDRLAVQADPLAHGGQVRAGEQPGAQAAGAQQRVDHARGRRLAVRPGDVDDRVGPLRVAEQAREVGDPVQGRIDGVLGPAFRDLPLDLGQAGVQIALA